MLVLTRFLLAAAVVVGGGGVASGTAAGCGSATVTVDLSTSELAGVRLSRRSRACKERGPLRRCLPVWATLHKLEVVLVVSGRSSPKGGAAVFPT